MTTNAYIPTILCTKVLSDAQRYLLLQAGVGLVEYNAISVSLLDAIVPPKVKNAIFTSANAVRAVLQNDIDIQRAFCVGEKTASLLNENGQNVVKIGQNASELAHFILKNHKKEQFSYFSGNRRRDELPQLFAQNNIPFSEQVVYETTLTPKAFERTFDGVLFFSPSGVESHIQKNTLQNTTAFCIGETTATEARKHSDNVIVANAQSVESVIAKAVKTLRSVHEK